MKQDIKKIISKFNSEINTASTEIPVSDLSVFFSVLISSFILNNRKVNVHIDKINSDNILLIFKDELLIIEKRFPELIKSFNETKNGVNSKLLNQTLSSLQLSFENINDDIIDIVSWSFQYLKKELTNNAFKKTGKNSNKIQDAELLLTTQFFTDSYMVKYLVDETLSNIKPQDLEKIVIIDPASGGGNFLNYSFEKLFYLFKSHKKDWTDSKIVNWILNNAIVGYDLDSNLSKIASLSLFINACQYSIPNKTVSINIFGGKDNDNLGFLNSKITSNSIQRSTINSKLKKFNKDSLKKIFLTNPPFMGKRDMDISLKNYLLNNYPESKGDLCVSFIQRIMQLMNRNDILAVVTQNNWMYLSSLKRFRELFLKENSLRVCVDLGTNAFEDINGEKTNVALCVIEKSDSSPTLFVNLKHKKGNEKKLLVSSNNIPEEVVYKVNQNAFLDNLNFEFNYQLTDRFKTIKKFNLYSNYGNPMQGTSTGNNKEFIKYAWEVNGNSDWKLVSKGGGFSKWIGLNYYKVLWGENAEYIKANKGSALRNLNKIPLTELVYSDTGTLGLNVRILKENQVFIASGPGIQVVKGDKYAHLAFLNSRVATFLLKLINPKFTISAGYISKIPVPENILGSKYISSKSKECLDLKDDYLKNKLPNFEFNHIDYSTINNLDNFINECILKDLDNDFQRLFLESKIENRIRSEYNFEKEELIEMKRMVGESPFYNKKTNKELSIFELDTFLSNCIDINCLSRSKTINGFSIGSESVLEELSYIYDLSPKVIYTNLIENIKLLKSTQDKYYKDLLHKLVLYELGVNHISDYTKEIISLNDLVQSLKHKYVFLEKFKDLNKTISHIVNKHHKSSFLNTPLISMKNKSVIVGQY
ncbi:Eco57I restriction-modification methylase domain-containing protein [Polaribacter uvawellassae]|uniref:Eco57I restriction-modification methylase domain-containing protein n=1 Tax=Polaribacter uvawellassae TaxID=3133495 RepID=UPI003219CCC4